MLENKRQVPLKNPEKKEEAEKIDSSIIPSLQPLPQTDFSKLSGDFSKLSAENNSGHSENRDAESTPDVELTVPALDTSLVKNLAVDNVDIDFENEVKSSVDRENEG